MTSTTDAATPADSAAPAEARPARAARPAKRRAEGQWALGYREPLNANEQAKKDDNPLNARARIENIYSKQGFDSIDKGDLRGRFRWWGLYTQREEGYDGTFTGDENIDLLEAKYFMMRVRCDAGALNVERCAPSPASRRNSAGTPPTCPTAKTSSSTGSRSRTPGDLEAPRSRRTQDHRSVR